MRSFFIRLNMRQQGRGIRCRSGAHTIQVVGRHEQLKTELRRNVQVGDTSRVTVLLIVVEVLAHLLEHHTVDVLEDTLVRL